MFEPKIIAYTGTHGTGKTSAVLQTAHKLKLAHPGKTIGWVTEVARQSPWPINQASPPEGQAWIFASHLRAELTACARDDQVVSDRTVVDAIAYTRVLGYAELAAGMLALARQHLHVYQQIVFCWASNNYCYSDGQRTTDPGFRDAVEQQLIGLYKELGAWDSLIMVK
jgi:predicted ATPase